MERMKIGEPVPRRRVGHAPRRRFAPTSRRRSAPNLIFFPDFHAISFDLLAVFKKI